MAIPSKYVFKGLHIVAWIIFVGLCIEAGGLIVNFIFSIYKPGFVENLYQKLDLTQLYTQNKFAFFGIYSFILFIAVLKAYLFYVLIMLLDKLDLSKPFNALVSEQIMQISYHTFSIGLIGYIAGETAKSQNYHLYGANLDQFWSDSQAFILMSAVIYVIAVIFRKGVELQNENDLTV